MAKRSDFAQKLLDDLRTRKERMAAAASHSSNHSNTMTIDAYAYSKQIHRGSGKAKTTGNITSGSRSVISRDGRSNRSLTIEEASNQLVPYGRGQSSQQMGNLSMALSLALENGGRIRTEGSRNSAMLGFLHQISRRSLSFDKRDKNGGLHPSTSYLPVLSDVHIMEISKVAQKLNQILKAYSSNGLISARNSIEIGQELLKGAIDLEGSLRMLVNLQEASQYMTSPQRKNKNRIVLLEDDNEEEGDTVEAPQQNQLGLPVLSFHMPSRNSYIMKEAKKNGLRQRPTVSDYPREVSILNREEQTMISAKPVSHRRSVSYSPDGKTTATFSDQKNQSNASQSKAAKGRISNVIAKLMGLDDIPQSPDSKKAEVASSMQKVTGKDLQPAASRNKEKTGSKTLDAEMTNYPQKKKLIEAGNNQMNTFSLQETTNQPAPSESLKAVGQLLLSKIEGIKPVTSQAKETSIKADKQQNGANQSGHKVTKQNGHHVNEKKANEVKHREQKATEKGESRGKVFENGLQQAEHPARKKPEPAILLPGKTGLKGSTVESERRYESKPKRKNHPKPRINVKDEIEQQNGKQNLQERKQKGRETISKTLSKLTEAAVALQKKHPDMQRKKIAKEGADAVRTEGFVSARRHKDLTSDRTRTDLVHELSNGNTEQHSNLMDTESVSGKEKAVIPPVMLEIMQNADIDNFQGGKEARKIGVTAHGSDKLKHLVRPFQLNSPILQEMHPRRQVKPNRQKGTELIEAKGCKEVETQKVDSNWSIFVFKPPIVKQEPLKETEVVPSLHSLPEDNFQMLKEPQVLSRNGNGQIAGSLLTIVPASGVDEKLERSKVVSSEVEESKRDRPHIPHPTQLEHQSSDSKQTEREELSESERVLKQILIASELFNNTARALFKLDVPVGNLDDSPDCQDQDSSLIVECSYEVMKRRWKRQELVVHPAMKIWTKPLKPRTLDSMVKQLYTDLQTVKFYGRNGKIECKVEEYLFKMLEIDVHDKDPDLNCMWDLGWNKIMFAFLERDDVIRDLEKHFLNVLIDEVTRDLLQL